MQARPTLSSVKKQFKQNKNIQPPHVIINENKNKNINKADKLDEMLIKNTQLTDDEKIK